ncbi:hypothetical protein C8N46_105269 [Kordia periserrulae]|uniref:Uncharacterized protein n=1 Tax=Kordia periserrulae TaxID=701523 RepID=A0A2T6BYG4_9FLAO|nr:hypothetical protein [Kordia periserrulae]PTX61113.1 hypothetical protein C8N46_105269 [Kordia periserrulae]
MYNILWFDDEHETLETIKEDALLVDITLNGCSNAADGLIELKTNEYDAIILDGLFYKNEDHSGNALNDEAFGEVAKYLGEQKAKGITIPWFIYSGQRSFVKDKNSLVNIFADTSFANGKVFDKNIDDDFEELCKEIKKAVDALPQTQIKNEYADVFEIFILGYLPNTVKENLINVLLQPLPTNNNELKAILTNIRSIQESCFTAIEAKGIFTNGLRSFKNKVKYLSGNITWDASQNKFVPTSTVYQTHEIELLQSWLYQTCGKYIHHTQNQVDYMISNYSVEALRNGLLEILLWFKKTMQENP